LLPVIAKYKIVSARTRYERFYPNQPLCWKAAAFAHEVNEIYENKMDLDESCASLESTDVSDSSIDSGGEYNNNSSPAIKKEIISFGDSMEERTATRIVSDQLSAVPKSVMFIASPSPVQILGQLCMLTNYMKYVCENDSSLDLEITPGQARKCAKAYLEAHKLDHHFASTAHGARIWRNASGEANAPQRQA
jgi:hypothetical protein